MTQEEKAKAYDEALERARQFSEHPLQEDSANVVEYIFPELRESEDGRMKKELIKFLQECHNIDSGFFSRYCEIPFAQMLAWLEKQGEQNPVEENKGNLGGISSNSAWTEGDEKQLNDIIELLPDLTNRHIWLKSLKGRVQPKPEWSEEDEDILNEVIRHFDGIPLKHPTHEVIGWLVSIKQRIKY